MARSMMHRPDSVQEAHCEPEIGVSVGWTAHEGAFGARMPLWNRDRNVCLILTGELFMEELSRSGAKGEHPLLDLYEREGPSFVGRLNGWFSGLLVDLRSETILLFNDRYGMARLYIHETENAVLFASEAKCLLRAFPHLRSLDGRSLAEWLTCGCVLEGRTLFPNIALLPPGSIWKRSRDGAVMKEHYFQPREWEEQPALDPEAYYTGLQDCFSRILPRYLNGPQPVAISLTGGVDSRLIMAWRHNSRRSVPCYSFSGPFRECQDAKVARKVALACGDTHQVIRIDDRFLTEFPALAAKAAYVSDGTMDATGAVELYVNNQARAIAPVRLTGNYGGEVLRSLVAFGPRPLSPLPFAPELRHKFAKASETFRSHRSGHPLSFIVSKQVPWHHYSRLSVEQSQLTLRSPFLDNDLVRHVYRAPSVVGTGKETSLRLIQNGRPELRNVATDRGLRTDSRPVVDAAWHRFLELMMKAEYAFDYGMPGWFVGIHRYVEFLHLDRAFLGRHKFYHFRHWYRHGLGGYLRETLLNQRTLERGHFDPKGLRKLVTAHVEGRGNHTVELNRILALELMQRQLLDAH